MTIHLPFFNLAFQEKKNDKKTVFGYFIVLALFNSF